MKAPIAEDITELVGQTPLLHLRRLVPPDVAGVYAKLEYLSPGGSVKDRAALGMIRRAEQEGRLRPGSVIVEATAGNTGIGLALMGVSRGYRVVIFMPEKFSVEKRVLAQALGAELHWTPDDEGMEGAIQRANDFASRTPSCFMAGQFCDPSVCDEVIAVRDADAFAMVKRLAAQEGVLAGSSGGAAVWAALELARRPGPGKRVGTLIPDSAERHLSKNIFDWKE
jgi:cysteine synthase